MEPSQFFRDLANRRALQAGAVREGADRESAIVQARDPGQRPRFIIAPQFHPFEWDIAAMQEVADHVAERVSDSSEESDLFLGVWL